jgi:hypothetical protein
MCRTTNFHVFSAIRQHLGGNRFKTDDMKKEVKDEAFTSISKTEELTPFCEKSVVIYILP